MRESVYLVLALALALLSTTANAASSFGTPDGEFVDAHHAPAAPEFVPGEVLVKFRPGASGRAVADAHRRNGGSVRETIPGINVQVVQVPAGSEKTKVAAYGRNPNVLYAEINGYYRALSHGTGYPQDPRVDCQYQYDNIGKLCNGTVVTADSDIDAFEAWGATQGSDTVAIAVLDTGIDQSHEDLKAKIKLNINCTSGVCRSGKLVDDKYGHGTHVAGSAAAITNNATGVAGTCPACVLYNVKVLNDNGSGSWGAIADGIRWSADKGAEVINMSLGGGGGSSAVQDAVNYAWSKGVVLVAAAGNNGSTSPSYPAYYTNVIAVASVGFNDGLNGFSNRGDWVDVAAHGRDILSTAPDHDNTIWGSGVRYGTLSGTSMASPHVAGVAGLVWSTGLCGAGDNLCVRSHIETYADDLDGTIDADKGTYWQHGRVNAYRSVTETVTRVESPGNGSAVAGSVAVRVAASTRAGGIGSVEVSIYRDANGDGYIRDGEDEKLALGTAAEVGVGQYEFSWETTSVPDGTYYIRASMTDGLGNSTNHDHIWVTVDNP